MRLRQTDARLTWGLLGLLLAIMVTQTRRAKLNAQRIVESTRCADRAICVHPTRELLDDFVSAVHWRAIHHGARAPTEVPRWASARLLWVIAGSNRDLPSLSAIPLKADVQGGAGLLLVFLGHAVLGVFDFAIEVGRLAGLFIRDGHEAEGIRSVA